MNIPTIHCDSCGRSVVPGEEGAVLYARPTPTIVCRICMDTLEAALTRFAEMEERVTTTPRIEC